MITDVSGRTRPECDRGVGSVNKVVRMSVHALCISLFPCIFQNPRNKKRWVMFGAAAVLCEILSLRADALWEEFIPGKTAAAAVIIANSIRRATAAVASAPSCIMTHTDSH